ncbi:MAG: PEP-CTERM sorting domain-containing protein [Sphaerospermopsis sp. SIO1G2]|nr:PEP-CTERM sorting domain-containing protein [Sphaerospermopsis sp. SIO1G2]
MNGYKDLLSIFTGLAIGATCVTAGEAIAVSITATANDDGTNTILTGTQLQDGDFSITANNGNPATTSLGDGRDETIRWDFDFNLDPNMGAFASAISGGGNLIKADLTFNLQPTNNLITTDSTGISGVQGIGIPNIPDVVNSVNQNITFTLDLLSYGFTPSNILTALNPNTPNTPNTPPNSNSIPWFWQDDVIMYSAELTLETSTPPATTPEPTTILGLLALGTLCVGTIKPKFLNQP